jgi:hypothetical protein
MKIEITEAKPEHIPQVLSICREFERAAYERLGVEETFTYLKLCYAIVRKLGLGKLMMRLRVCGASIKHH